MKKCCYSPKEVSLVIGRLYRSNKIDINTSSNVVQRVINECKIYYKKDLSEHYGKIASLLHYYKTHPQAKLFKNLKIRTETHNEILLSCPFIDRIKDLLADHCDKLDPEVVVEMNHKLELIRRVNEELRHVLENKEVSVDLSTFKEEPYNFNAVIKAIKLKFRKDKDVIDEIVKVYY